MSYIQLTFDILKFLTPYILALVVYIFWHIQKEKEVLAIESKNLIIKLNELIDLSWEVFDLIYDANRKQKDLAFEEIANLKNHLVTFKIKIRIAIDTLAFLSEAIGKKSISELEDSCNSKLMQVYNEYELQVFYLEKNEMTMTIEELVEIHNKLVETTNVTKRIFFDYALFKNRKIRSVLKMKN